jgi:hypothetical protein
LTVGKLKSQIRFAPVLRPWHRSAVLPYLSLTTALPRINSANWIYIPRPINEQITIVLTTAQTSTHSMSSTQSSNIHAGMSSPPQRLRPDPSGYDPAVYEILFGPTLAKGVECPAYGRSLSLLVPADAPEDAPEDPPEDEFSRQVDDILNGTPRATSVEAPAASRPLKPRADSPRLPRGRFRAVREWAGEFSKGGRRKTVGWKGLTCCWRETC